MMNKYKKTIKALYHFVSIYLAVSQNSDTSEPFFFLACSCPVLKGVPKKMANFVLIYRCLSQGLVKGAKLCFRYPYFYFRHFYKALV